MWYKRFANIALRDHIEKATLGKPFYFALIITAAATFLANSAKGLMVPVGYPTTHWLLSYDFGFIKRGLIGTLVQPLFLNKSSTEIHSVIRILSLFVFFVVCCALVAVSVGALHRAKELKAKLMIVPLVFVFVTSSFIASNANIVGFFDHFLIILTIGSIFAIFKRAYFLVPLFSVVGVAIHELHILVGFPVVCFAFIVEHFSNSPIENSPYRKLWLRSTIYLGPAMLFWLFIAVFQFNVPQDQVDGLSAQMSSYGVLNERGVPEGTNHLKTEIEELFRTQSHMFVERVTDPTICRAVLPPLVLLMIVSAMLLFSSALKLTILVLVAACLSPILIVLVAFDVERFTSYAILHSFLALFSILIISPPKSTKRVFSLTIAILSAVVLINNTMTPPPLMLKAVDGGVMWPRSQLPRKLFRHREALFENSNFEKGNFDNWTVNGKAFEIRSSTKKRGLESKRRSRKSGPEHKFWLGSSESTTMQKKELVGSLTSKTFKITRSRIVYLLGCTKGEGRTVALFVDNRQVHLTKCSGIEEMTPVVIDVEEYLGKTGRILIKDNEDTIGATMSVDGFYFQ